MTGYLSTYAARYIVSSAGVKRTHSTRFNNNLSRDTTVFIPARTISGTMSVSGSLKDVTKYVVSFFPFHLPIFESAGRCFKSDEFHLGHLLGRHSRSTVARSRTPLTAPAPCHCIKRRHTTFLMLRMALASLHGPKMGMCIPVWVIPRIQSSRRECQC